MTQEKIKLVNQGLNVDANAMLMMRDLASADKGSNYQSPANQSTLTPKDGIKIYIKAVEKLGSGLEEVKSMMEMYNQKKNNNNDKVKSEARKLHIEITLKVNEMMKIVEEFIQGVAVVHELDAKDFMSLLYYRFTFIKDNLDLFFVTNKVSYAADIKIVLNRLESTFKKMLKTLDETTEDKASDESDGDQVTQVSV